MIPIIVGYLIAYILVVAFLLLFIKGAGTCEQS
jgi:hypothetical protein